MNGETDELPESLTHVDDLLKRHGLYPGQPKIEKPGGKVMPSGNIFDKIRRLLRPEPKTWPELRPEEAWPELTPEEQTEKASLLRSLGKLSPEEKKREQENVKIILPYYQEATPEDRKKLRREYRWLDEYLLRERKVSMLIAKEEAMEKAAAGLAGKPKPPSLSPDLQAKLEDYDKADEADKEEYRLMYEDLNTLLIKPKAEGGRGLPPLRKGLTQKFLWQEQELKKIPGGTEAGGRTHDEKILEFYVNHREFADWYLASKNREPLPKELTPGMYDKLKRWKAQEADAKLRMQRIDPDLNAYVLKYEKATAPSPVGTPEDWSLYGMYGQLKNKYDKLRFRLQHSGVDDIVRDKGVSVLPKGLTVEVVNALEKYAKASGEEKKRNLIYDDPKILGVWATKPKEEGGLGLQPLPPRNYWKLSKLNSYGDRALRRSDAELERYMVEELGKDPVAPASYEVYLKSNNKVKLAMRKKDRALNAWLEEYTNILPLKARTPTRYRQPTSYGATRFLK